MTKATLGVIVGNRGFFPSHLCKTGRKTILEVLKAEGIRAVIVGEKDTPFGSIESYDDAKKCAALFKKNRDRIDGVLVTLPNFGDERAVANALRLSGLDVPVLVHAFADASKRMTVRHRRDSFCGKMSVCNNLRQYGFTFSLTDRHTVDPETDAFREDLRRFAAVCRVVRGLRGARVGAIGARPAAFNTVRFSEKLLEAHGISVETIDLSEVFGRAGRLRDGDPKVKAKLAAIRRYTKVKGVPDASLVRMAKLGAVIDGWMEENELVASAIQCWTSMEEFFGVVPCTVMSMMSNALRPERVRDGHRRAARHARAPGGLRLALRPARLEQQLRRRPRQGRRVPLLQPAEAAFFAEQQMDYQEIIAGSVGKENTFGTIVGRIRPGPFTYCRVSTDDIDGRIAGYVGEGEVTDDPAGHLRRLRRDRDPGAAGPAGVPSARTASSTTSP